MENRPLISRRRYVIAGGVLVALTLALGVLIVLRDTVRLDEAWMSEVLEWRDPLGERISLVFDFLGGGWFAIFAVPLGVGAAFVLARRPWSALVFVLVSALTAVICQLLKALFDRARPEQILLPLDNGAFPSGHVANAAVIAVGLGLLLGRVWVWVLGALYVVAMSFSRTYLGAHWLTDTLGGALLGAGVALLVWCLLLPRLRREPLPRGSGRGLPKEPAST
ncbi:MAG: hypothetical protein DI534_07255 [Leifsonia xyli]|nr:MAG: hypothetical protein DI534_07255 [Leifsonia xyli]